MKGEECSQWNRKSHLSNENGFAVYVAKERRKKVEVNQVNSRTTMIKEKELLANL